MKVLDKLNIKQIVKLGVLIISIAIISFIISTLYLINVLNQDQVTIKKVIKLEEHNKKIIHTIKELDNINSKILLSDNYEDLEKLEILFSKRNANEKRNLITSKGKLQNNYNENIFDINALINKQEKIQREIYDISKLKLFYEKEINNDILRINKKINSIIKITNNISGKLSLSNKRLKKNIYKQIEESSVINELTINDIKKLFSLNNERVITLSKHMDKGILKLYNLPKDILFVRNIDQLNDIKANRLYQNINHFENNLSLLRIAHNSNTSSLDKITLEFLEIKSIITYILNLRENMFFLDGELKKLRDNRKTINIKLYAKNDKIIDIAENIQLNTIKNSENIIKNSIIIALLISTIFTVLILIAAKTLLLRINTPLSTIIDFIENFKLDKIGLSQKLPIKNNDEFTQLSKVFNSLTETISNNIHEISKLNKELEQRVYERTEELEDANEELQASIYNLKQTQEKLIESEKMASLGSLVAGVAHEINTPVGIGLTGATHFLDLTKEIRESYDKDEMSQEVFENYLNNAKELTTLITSNLSRTAKLVKSFKQIAVDQSVEEKRRINLKEYLTDTIFSLGSITKKIDLDINILDSSSLEINTYPGYITQVFTNLIINSIKHGFKGHKKGTIELDIQRIENKVQLKYTDNGNGIKKENLNKIFDPFFTTNRESGGTGLGLNIIYNIVTSKLNGTITCSSEENKGVEFIIKFPIQN